MEREQKAIRADLLKICWFMRGGITLDEAFALSNEDKEIISGIIKENLETTKNSGLPFF